MFDHLYALTPEESIANIDGHLLVVLLGDDALSGLYEDFCTRRVIRLSDHWEFQLSTVSATDFPDLAEKAPELPALFHFVCGREHAYVVGVDACVDFLKEFIDNNKRQ